ncbi:MAG: CDP-alcohol phosphatidyltransferase family protein [Vicinamibacteria bacterium]
MTTSLAVLLAVLALAVASMAAFAVLHRGRRDADAARKGSRFLLGAGDFLVHWFMWAIGPAERALTAAGATPDHMNAGGLLFGLASGVAIALGRLELGGWAIALAGVCDILDGRLARARAWPRRTASSSTARSTASSRPSRSSASPSTSPRARGGRSWSRPGSAARSS